MPIPVKFYSVTAEEYERIKQEMLEACHIQEQQEEEERKRDLEGGIFFVEERDNHANKGEINKVN